MVQYRAPEGAGSPMHKQEEGAEHRGTPLLQCTWQPQAQLSPLQEMLRRGGQLGPHVTTWHQGGGGQHPQHVEH